MFSPEVADQRRKVRAYGIDKIDNYPGMRVNSYKAQALRELAKRLEMEEIIKELKEDQNKLIDKLEKLEE
jgi:hypothetical protein